MKPVGVNSARAWLLAVRPKTLTGAAVPVVVGTALAVANGTFKWVPALICLLFAAWMQVAANLINDLYDFLKGSDRTDRLGPERACAQGWITPGRMKAGIGLTLLAACVTGLFLLLYAGPELILVGAVCVLFAFFYTTGPYPLSYNGWGDVLVWVFFGLVPVGGTYYVQAGVLPSEVLVAALACGMVIDTLLVVNNYRDREADARSGKRTVVVRFGEPFGRYLYLLQGVVAVLLSGWVLWRMEYDWWNWVLLLPYLLLHVLTWREMVRVFQGRELNRILGKTSRNMLVYGLVFALALLL